LVEQKKKTGFINTIFSEGNVVTLLGHMGSGKTDKAVFFMEWAVTYGFHIYTIINFFDYNDIGRACNMQKLRRGVVYRKKPDEIHVVRKLSDLLLGLFEHQKNIVVLDEAGLFVSSTAATSKRVRTLKQLTYIIRHLNASILFIAQSRKSLVPELRESLVTYQLKVKKMSENNRRLTVSRPIPYVTESGVEAYDFQPIDTIDNMPSSQLPYDSKFLPVFKIDIDLNDLLDDLADLDSMEVVDKGADIIRKKMGLLKETEKYETVAEYARRVKQHPHTIRRKCSDGTIEAIKLPGGKTWRIPVSNTT